MRTKSEKDQEFLRLTREAKSCRLCPRMNASVRVIGPASGSLHAPILIIGEAPGRLGADESAIPFHGDKAGENFEALIEQVGLTRHDVFITNAALCNPKDENGNNATPKGIELRNCSAFLRRQIEIVDPKIIVTLGLQALNALKLIEPHEIDLANGVRKSWQWHGRILIPMYHPGQRAMIHRSFANQLADYQFLYESFRRVGSRNRRASTVAPTSSTIAAIAEKLASNSGGISYFALHKLFYLAEYEFFRSHGRRMTAAYIVRQKDGPYVFEMHIKKLKKAIGGLKTWQSGNRLMLQAEKNVDFFARSNIPKDLDLVIDRVLTKYGAASDAELKRVVYLTEPMRRILRQEKTSRNNFFNRPIDFGSTDAQGELAV
ncbi:MAG: uracil-DNA glycosylase [Proteobacteria bacterium]|nr:uracil-DNA glycosylase [Pseudomonadota bacterium]